MELKLVRKTNWIILFILLVICFNFLYNIQYFSEYFWDQGVYIQRAINFQNNYQVYENPQYIDHPPLGWIILSFFFKLVGFPDSVIHGSQNIDSQLTLYLVPRIFALIFTISSAILVYKITTKLYRSTIFALMSLATFALIPAMLPFRNILLDHMMITFVLLSIFLIIDKSKIKNNISGTIPTRFLIYSGLLFGMAVLVKLTAVFFLPLVLLFALGYGSKADEKIAIPDSKQGNSIVLENISRKQRVTSAIVWSLPLVTVILAWLLYVVQLDDGLNNLIYTQTWQVSRASTLPYGILPILFLSSPVGTIFGIFGLVKILLNRELRVWSILAIPYIIFLFRGGYVGFVHIIPLLPVLCIFAGQPLYQFVESQFNRVFSNSTKKDVVQKSMMYFMIFILAISCIVTIWIASFDVGRPDRDATKFLVDNMHSNAVLVTDPGYGWIIQLYRPDIKVIDYFTLNYLDKIPKEVYIAEKADPSSYDQNLKQSELIYKKSCFVKEFHTEPPPFHPYLAFTNKFWNVEIRYFDSDGCSNLNIKN